MFVDKGAGGGVQGRSPAGDPSFDLYESLKNFLKTLFSLTGDDLTRDFGMAWEGLTCTLKVSGLVGVLCIRGGRSPTGDPSTDLHEPQKSFYNILFSLEWRTTPTVTRGWGSMNFEKVFSL